MVQVIIFGNGQYIADPVQFGMFVGINSKGVGGKCGKPVLPGSFYIMHVGVDKRYGNSIFIDKPCGNLGNTMSSDYQPPGRYLLQNAKTVANPLGRESLEDYGSNDNCISKGFQKIIEGRVFRPAM